MTRFKMANEIQDSEKETLLTETLSELKTRLQELGAKKQESQQKLDSIKTQLEATQEAEHKAEDRMKDILQVEAKLEELMNEERKLLREKDAAEAELFEFKKKIDKIDRINKGIMEGEGNSQG